MNCEYHDTTIGVNCEESHQYLSGCVVSPWTYMVGIHESLAQSYYSALVFTSIYSALGCCVVLATDSRLVSY